MTTIQEVFDKYDEVAKDYLEKFGEDAPERLPIEFEGAIVEMVDAIRTGVALPQLPENAST